MRTTTLLLATALLATTGTVRARAQSPLRASGGTSVGTTLGTTAATASRAPVTRARVWLVPRADSVFVFLVEPPGIGGFTLARVAVGVAGAAPETLTPTPVRGERDPRRLADRLGTDLPLVQRAVGAVDEVELARRLTSDRFMGTVASALYRNVAIATGRLYVDTSVVVGAEYEYRVSWVRADGSADPRHVALTARVRVADVPLLAPNAAKVEGHDDRATVSWTHPRYTGDVRDHVVAFVVERADEAGGFRRVSTVPVLRNDAVPRLTFADTGLRVGTRYRYRVRAVDIAGREGPANGEVMLVARDATAPATPTGLRLEPGDSRVLVQWSVGRERDLAGYWVERALALDRPYVRLTPAPVGVSHPAYVDSAVTGPWQHFYRVVAVDSAGNESRPTTALDASPVDRRPPLAPAGLATSVARRQATLRWPASTSRDLLGYHVYRGPAPDRLVRLTTRPITTTQYVDSGYERRGLAPGAAYVVAVTAVDQSFNESARREARVEIPDDEPPRPPASVRAADVRGRAVELTWSASPSRDAAVYVVTRTGSDGDTRALGRYPAAGALALRDTAGLVHGRWYRYRVVAEDGAGNRSAATSDSTGFVDGEPPSPTRHASAVLAAGSVTLQWEPVMDAELAGFHVYRATLPTGVGERLTSAPVNGTTFVDRAGRADSWYVVTAVDRSGNESSRADAVQPVMRATAPAAPTRAARTAPARAQPPVPARGPTLPGTRLRAPRRRDTGLR